MQIVTNLGEIGAAGGILSPQQFLLDRAGAVWDLTGFSNPDLAIWDLRTKEPFTPSGTVLITNTATGEVTWTPAAGDPIAARSGVYEGRIWLDKAGGGDPEPSGIFRFSIAAGPPPTPPAP